MATPKFARDRMATLCALEVLKLIADQVEKHGNVDLEDINAVLLFMRDIAHPCLDNTKTWLLLPFLQAEIEASQRNRVGAVLQNHDRLCGLLDELERCLRASLLDEFVTNCRTYTTVFGDLIYEEDCVLPILAPQEGLAQFDIAEAALASRARQVAPALRRLETKYVSPHCI
jgi:hemerythrin-like domain-containing protein